MSEIGEQVPLREKAYESFTRRLLARDVKPGQFVSQRVLVELTGLTLGAVRELIPRLEAEGLIKTVPQRGLQIAHIDVNLIREAFQFRILLEKEAVDNFVRAASDAAIEDLLRQHREILDELHTKGASADLEQRAQTVDWSMHNAFVDAMDNSIISNAYRVNSIKTRLINQERHRIDGRVGPVMEEHLAILEAVQRRSAEDAARHLLAHVSNARDRALAI